MALTLVHQTVRPIVRCRFFLLLCSYIFLFRLVIELILTNFEYIWFAECRSTSTKAMVWTFEHDNCFGRTATEVNHTRAMMSDHDTYLWVKHNIRYGTFTVVKVHIQLVQADLFVYKRAEITMQ